MKYILRNEQVKQNAIAEIKALEISDKFLHEVSIRRLTRSLLQNAKFHSICDSVSKSGVKWAGKERTPTEWKNLLISAHAKATNEDTEIVLGIEGELVCIREKSATMTVARMNSLIEYCLAFCTEKNINIIEKRYE